MALNAVQFLVWHKTFRPATNILGPVEGQGICLPVELYRKILMKSEEKQHFNFKFAKKKILTWGA